MPQFHVFSQNSDPFAERRELEEELKNLEEEIANFEKDITKTQQEKNTQSAKLSAMKDKKERMKREGIALGNQYREIARGVADKYIAEGSGEFGEINAIVNALEEAKDLPLYLMFRELEVEQQRIKKWGGLVPSTVSGDLTDAFVPSNVVIDDESVIRKIDEGLKTN